MVYQNVILGEDDESRRNAILSNLGRKVVLKDFHDGQSEGVLQKKGYDGQTYWLENACTGAKTRFHYHDLEELAVLRRYVVRPVPEGFVKYPALFRI